jgi:hypothetical protein
MRGWARSAEIVLVAVLGIMVATIAMAAGQSHFATTEAARDALVKVLESGDPDGLAPLFGAEHEAALIGEDKAAARGDMEVTAGLAKEAAIVRNEGPDRATLVLGRIAWPFPVPLVHESEGWRFDTVAGLDEVINRRIGRNELAALGVMRAFVDAERLYASEDRDGDEVLEYAQRLLSTGTAHDGLYWRSGPGEAESPFGPFVTDAEPYIEGREQGEPYRGYYFRVLTRQGPDAPGGEHDYVINGNMVAGFALFAFPAAYGDTGIMSFLVGPNGIVLEKDLGAGTSQAAELVQSFDPDSSWQPSTD